MRVYKKLQDARIRLQSMKLEKTGHNKFANYYYFEIGDFLPAVQVIFHKLGLCGVVSFSSDVATLRIVDVNDGQEIVITSPLSSAELKGCHPIQNIGACELYSRRYLWVAAMEIVEHDAIDSQPLEAPIKAGPPAPAAPPKPAVLSDSDISDVGLAMRECDDVEILKGIFGAAWKKASKTQKPDLKASYDAVLNTLTKGE
jgi:hypothetical protein